MATINLIPNKRKINSIQTSKKDNTIHRTVYNTTSWRNLRISYLMEHPICEKCEKELAIDVHHKVEISTATNIDEMKQLGFNKENLMAVCKNCHKIIHNNQNIW